jgi:hypothetical protein
MPVPRLVFPVLLLAALAACDRLTVHLVKTEDPLAAEIESCAAAKECQGAVEALRDGRRLLAMKRLATARADLETHAYMRARPAEQRRDMAGFEAEWTRLGEVMRGELGEPSPADLDDIEPALVRAVGEAALLQVKGYYQASLDQGRSTTPTGGLFYLGSAHAQRELVNLCRTLSEPTPRRAPPVRALHADLAALESELLAAYRPPASVDRHSWFINVSATLKEARELNAAGLRYGALLRYLQAAQLFSPLRSGAPALDAGALPGRLRELDARLTTGDLDHSLGRMFLEAAQADIAAAAPGKSPATALAIVNDVLPRYFAALQPAPPAALQPAGPQATVTLVRWPYT